MEMAVMKNATLLEKENGGSVVKNNKKVQPHENPRKVLGDIGNLVSQNAVKPAQAGKELVKIVDEPEVIETSSDESETKRKPVDTKTSIRKRNKEKDKTFTAILTARSKALADAEMINGEVVDPTAGDFDKELEMGLDLDSELEDDLQGVLEEDLDNELAVVEYVSDMYTYFKRSEDTAQVEDYMEAQPDISAKMRAILLDWLLEVHGHFRLNPETLYLTVNIIDRFLSVVAVKRTDLQLVGISSMLIASKYEEICPPEVHDLVWLSDKQYVRKEILAMEKAILGIIQWSLTVPTLYVFVVRYTQASIRNDREMLNMVFYLAMLGLMDYQFVIRYRPSLIAAGAVYAARCMLGKTPLCNKRLTLLCGYAESELVECAQRLLNLHGSAGKSQLKGIFKKFSSVARLAPAIKRLTI